MADRKLALNLIFNGTGNLSAMMRRMVGEGGQARQALKKLSDEARLQKKEMSDLQKSLAGASGNVTDLMNKEKALAAAIAKTNSQLERQKAAIARQGRADAMGRAAQDAGTKNLTTGATVGAGLFFAGKMATDYQDGMTDIQQKADLSAAATAKLERNIMASAKAAKQLPENMRQGVDILAGFGMTPEQAAQMMTPIGRAATAYRAEISDLSAASYANFSNLKVPVDQAAGAINAMAQAGKMGAFEIKDMASYFPSLTAQAQAFGQTGTAAVADLAAALQIARKGAGSSEQAARNVENLLAKINMEDTIKNFAAFGIDLPKAMKKAYAEGKTPLEAIAELTQKATGGDLSKVSFLFGDMQAQGAIRPLIQNLEEYRQIRAEAAKAGQAGLGKGVVDADFALRAQNASVQARALQGNLIAIAMTAGQHLLPTFAALSEKALSLTERFSVWAAKNPATLDLIVKLVAGFAALNLGLGAARLLFGNLVGPTMSLFNGLAKLGQAGPILVRAFGMMRMAAMFLARGVMQAGLMMMANPIVLVITAIVAAIAIAAYFIWKYRDKIAAAFTTLVTWLAQVWTNIKAAIATGVRMALQAFMLFTPAGWLLRLVPGMLKIGGQIMDGLIQGIKDKLSAVKTMILGIAGKVAGWFKGVLGIHSPSRVFMAFGGHISNGLAIGMQNGMKAPLRAARNMAAGTLGAAALAASPSMAAAPAPGASVTFGSVTIHIHTTANQNPQDIATAVRAELEAMARTTATRARGSYGDDAE
ncbi:phage tail tape measure protein [Asticcacaulis sp. BYS171W]|uniref:Phage tail tape measure protein n=1 Tax=Asticcacaulis aquaticus TaxID=2984212 RepID=A0ABT5HT67_9CAUL|nr:phage tail tape measure protein [Asticcacaulis aquaticus]MDC7683266.1 phage tail tape measure protein [Asticcacaulis aquaticus]